MKDKIGNKKGFLFTAVVVLVLFVLVLAVSFHVQAINEREQRAEEKFKFIAMGQIFDMISEQEVGDFAEKSSFYALYSLNEHIVNKTRPLKQDGTASETGGNKGTKYINMSIYKLMTNGSVPVGYFSSPVGGDYTYSDIEKSKYTFAEWGNKINQICAQLGYTCSISDIRNFSYVQNDSWSVNIYFEATTNVESNDGRFNRTQNITVNRTYSFEGFNDPAVSIIMKEESGVEEARRQIFKYKNLSYPNLDDININLLSSLASKGKGFFYGPILEFKETVNETTPGVIVDVYSNSKSPKYIVNSKASDWLGLTEDQKETVLESYGAFIVKDVENECTEYNASNTKSGTYSITLCAGYPTEITREVDIECTATCTYQDCDATFCPFDCYEGLTSCSWNEELFLRTFVSDRICDGSHSENVLDVFVRDYSTDYSLLCNRAEVSTPPDLGTGTVTRNMSKPYLMYYVGDSSPSFGTNKPLNYPDMTDELYGDLSRRTFVLINNENDHDVLASDAFDGFHELWDIKDLREMVMCGAYIETNKSDVYGPSFFQRMVEDSWELNSEKFGLETFLVGPYAGGHHSIDTDNLCQLDRNFARDKSADYLIKGMPGCNSFDMTSTYEEADDPVSEFGIGHFSITEDIMEQYRLERIACEADNGARCD